jgi:hypothetical protein
VPEVTGGPGEEGFGRILRGIMNYELRIWKRNGRKG